MSSLTLHNIDEDLARLIKERAQQEGLSLNRTIKKLLAQALGMVQPDKQRHRNEFAEFCGMWSHEEFEEFQRATADQRAIDPQDWK